MDQRAELSLDEAYELFDECETFQETGELHETAKLRKVAAKRNKRVTVTDLQMACLEVYRVIAQELIAREKVRWNR